MKSVHKRGSAGAYHPRAPGKPGPPTTSRAFSEAQLELEFAVVPQSSQGMFRSKKRSLVAVPADVGCLHPPSDKGGPMVPSGCDLSLYPPGV